MKLSHKTPFTFLPLASLSDLGVNFRDSCRRLWRVLVTEGAFGGLTPTKCIHCREFTCIASCIDERSSTPKVSIDIGGKITWLVTPGFALKVSMTIFTWDITCAILRQSFLILKIKVERWVLPLLENLRFCVSIRFGNCIGVIIGLNSVNIFCYNWVKLVLWIETFNQSA